MSDLVKLREAWFKENPTAYEVVTGKTEDYRILSLKDLIATHDQALADKDLELRKAKVEIEELNEQRNESLNTNLLLVEWKFKNEDERLKQLEKEKEVLNAEVAAAVKEIK